MTPNCWPVLTWIPAATAKAAHIVRHTHFIVRRIVKHYAVVPVHRAVHKAGIVKAGAWGVTVACAGGAAVVPMLPTPPSVPSWVPPLPFIPHAFYPVPEPGSLLMLATALALFFSHLGLYHAAYRLVDVERPTVDHIGRSVSGTSLVVV